MLGATRERWERAGRRMSMVNSASAKKVEGSTPCHAVSGLLLLSSTACAEDGDAATTNFPPSASQWRRGSSPAAKGAGMGRGLEEGMVEEAAIGRAA
jgi:hypothetical protein